MEILALTLNCLSLANALAYYTKAKIMSKKVFIIVKLFLCFSVGFFVRN